MALYYDVASDRILLIGTVSPRPSNRSDFFISNVINIVVYLQIREIDFFSAAFLDRYYLLKTKSHCRNAKELHCSFMHWHVPFIGNLLESCTSGLTANRKVKCMLRASLLKGDRGNAWMAGCPDVAWWLMNHLVTEALWALMHIDGIGCYHIPTLTHGVSDKGGTFPLAKVRNRLTSRTWSSGSSNGSTLMTSPASNVSSSVSSPAYGWVPCTCNKAGNTLTVRFGENQILNTAHQGRNFDRTITRFWKLSCKPFVPN